MYHCFQEKLVIARKPYRCIYCGDRIENKESHIHEKSIYDGNWQDHRWHSECLEDKREFGDDEFIPYSSDRPLIL